MFIHQIPRPSAFAGVSGVVRQSPCHYSWTEHMRRRCCNGHVAHSPRSICRGVVRILQSGLVCNYIFKQVSMQDRFHAILIGPSASSDFTMINSFDYLSFARWRHGEYCNIFVHPLAIRFSPGELQWLQNADALNFEFVYSHIEHFGVKVCWALCYAPNTNSSCTHFMLKLESWNFYQRRRQSTWGTRG